MIRSWIAVAVVTGLAGCATVAPPAEALSPPPLRQEQPEQPPLSLHVPEPIAALPAEPVRLAEPVAASDTVLSPPLAVPAGAPLRVRIADFIARRLLKKPGKTGIAASAHLADGPTAAEAPIDEKYRLTGEAARELERGRASWYGGQFHGRRTASGENYDKYALTAAHKTLPFGTIVRVRSLTLGREVDVRINDRGPYAHGRVIDVSQAAAEALGLMASGVVEVSLNLADSLQEVIVSPQPVRKNRVKPRRP